METGNGSDMTGSVSEIVQNNSEYPILPISNVPVTVDGPIQVHQLPARSAGMRNWTGITTATRVGNNDGRRKRAVLLVYSATATDYVIIGTNQNEADSNYGFRLAPGIPLEITHQEEIYAKANAAGVVLSVINENWAD